MSWNFLPIHCTTTENAFLDQSMTNKNPLHKSHKSETFLPWLACSLLRYLDKLQDSRVENDQMICDRRPVELIHTCEWWLLSIPPPTPQPIMRFRVPKRHHLGVALSRFETTISGYVVYHSPPTPEYHSWKERKFSGPQDSTAEGGIHRIVWLQPPHTHTPQSKAHIYQHVILRPSFAPAELNIRCVEPYAMAILSGFFVFQSQQKIMRRWQWK